MSVPTVGVSSEFRERRPAFDEIFSISLSFCYLRALISSLSYAVSLSYDIMRRFNAAGFKIQNFELIRRFKLLHQSRFASKAAPPVFHVHLS